MPDSDFTLRYRHPEQIDYLIHALDVTCEHDHAHLDWLLRGAAATEADRDQQNAETEGSAYGLAGDGRALLIDLPSIAWSFWQDLVTGDDPSARNIKVASSNLANV